MLRRLTRWAAVPVSTLALGALSVAGAPAAEALGSCTSPVALSGAGAGAFTSAYGEDYWRYQAAGTTTIRMVATSAWMYVYYSGTSCSTYICSSFLSCTVSVTGPLVIKVVSQADGAAYVLAATSSVASTNPCNRVNTNGVCVDLAIGPVLEEETVYGVTTTPLLTHTVGGWLDAYRFPLPTGGSAVVPCVVLAANSRDANPCATAGGTFVSRTLTLVSQSVTQPQVVQGSALTTVRVCNATLTATANGFGIENVPVYSTC